MLDPRMSKIEANLLIAKDVALRSPCIERRRFGAILVKDDCIIATGYCGSVRGAMNSGIDFHCLKNLYNEGPMKSYEHCPSVHAEMNVILNAARKGTSTIGATLFLSSPEKGDRPCFLCRRFCIQAGIKDCYYTNKDGSITHEEISDWVNMENEWMSNEQNGKR
jgi:dCMP deaminase